MFAFLPMIGGLFGLKGKTAGIVGGGITLIVALGVLYGAWAIIKHNIIKTDRLEQNNKVLETTGKANEKSAEERLRDQELLQKQREELNNASQPVNDGLTVRQRRGCIILRQQGQDLRNHPICSRLAS